MAHNNIFDDVKQKMMVLNTHIQEKENIFNEMNNLMTKVKEKEQDIVNQITKLEKMKQEFDNQKEEFTEYKKEFSNQKAEFDMYVDTQKKYLNEKEEKICNVIDKMETVCDFDKRIKLNVGGKIYETYLDTLILHKDSMLGIMFSGKYNLDKDDNGCYFIDRDGDIFRYIF